MLPVNLLALIRPEHADRFSSFLGEQPHLTVTVVSEFESAVNELDRPSMLTDILILDHGLERVYDFIPMLRENYPRLLILLVDEDADFATPGLADDITTTPFSGDDLVRRIQRLISDRRLETLRADVMPPVREFGKALRKATGEIGKQQVAVNTCKEMGYDYAAFFKIESSDPAKFVVKAQAGNADILAIAPRELGDNNIVSWVAKTGHSASATPNDEINYVLVKRGRMQACAAIPVGTTNRTGILLVCREGGGSITPQQILVLELVSAQLANIMSRDTIS